MISTADQIVVHHLHWNECEKLNVVFLKLDNGYFADLPWYFDISVAFSMKSVESDKENHTLIQS